MPIALRFTKSADDSRPYGSHRYDVYGPKVARTLALYGQASLRTWTLLESDPGVVSYCERPMVIMDANPKRVVDFWVKRYTEEEMWLLLRNSELEGTSYFAPSGAFAKWCSMHHIHTKYLAQPNLQDDPVFFDNWGAIIRYLSFSRQPSSELARKLMELTCSAKSLTLLESSFPDMDPAAIRNALFALMHQGYIQCLDIRDKALGPRSTFIAT